MNLNDAIKKVKEGFDTGVKPAENSFEDAVITLADNVGQGGGGGDTPFTIVDLGELVINVATLENPAQIPGIFPTVQNAFELENTPIYFKGIYMRGENGNANMAFPLTPAIGYYSAPNNRYVFYFGNYVLNINNNNYCWYHNWFTS